MGILSRQYNRGFTLVEIMVTLLIVFIVLGGVYKTIVNENVDLEREEIILDMQNNARIAMDRISAAVRGSGFMGCGGELMVNTLNNAGTTKPTLLSMKTSAVNDTSGNDDYWDLSASIATELKGTTNVNWLGESIGFHNDALPKAPALTHPRYNAGTDAITLGFLTGEVALANAMGATNADVDLVKGMFMQDDIILVTDCEDYSLFQKTNGDDTPAVEHEATGLNSTKDLGKEYGSKAQARAFKLDFETFFIRDDSAPIPTLYHNRSGTPIASNIEDLQFEFYFDIDQDDDLNEPNEWRQSISGFNFDSGAPVTSRDVRAVRIYILARSEPVSGYTNTNTYDYPNSPYYSAANPFVSINASNAASGGLGGAPNDNRFRYLAETEIYIRNAGLKL